MKEELYDELCKALTWFEHPEEYDENATLEDVANQLYEVGVKIQNEFTDKIIR